MGQIGILFVLWWCGVCLVLAFATWRGQRRSDRLELEAVLRVLLIGICAGLVLYVVPSGVKSIQTAQDFELRFFGALGIAWLATIRLVDVGRGAGEASSLALAGLVGASVPPLALAAAVTMVCGGRAGCL